MTLTVPSDATIERGDYMEPLYRNAGQTEWKHFGNSGNESDEITDKMPLDLHSSTSITYQKGTSTFTINSFIGVKWSIYRPDGTLIRTSNATSTATKLNLSAFPNGTYKLELSYAGQEATIYLTY